MGEESAVSGMSGVSSADQSGAQAAGSGKRGRGPIILVIGLLAIAGVVGALFVAGVFENRGSTEHETEEDSPSHSGTGTGGGNGGPPAHPDDGHVTPDTNAKPRRAQSVMCTTRYPGPGNDPPQHLCDIVVYDADKTDLSNSPPQEVGFFIDYCKKGLSACGINIEITDGVTAQLDTPETKKVMEDFYAAGIKNYGRLRSELLSTTKLDDIEWNVDLLAKLERPMKLTGDNHDTLFWGVSPVLKGASPPDSMVKVFRDFMKLTHVNMLVYQTTFAANVTGKCVSSGPAMWKSSFYNRQTTFVDALNFWKAVKENPLPGVADMFAVTLCGYWAEYSPFGAQLKFNIATNCKQTKYDYIEQSVCPESLTVNQHALPGAIQDDELQYLAIETSLKKSVGYDLDDTIVKKMCKAKSDYGYEGGWVVHSLQCNFKQFCRGKDVGGFPRLRVMDEALQENLSRC